jgi:putative Mg2+ transporter-C (MgtC) family protein
MVTHDLAVFGRIALAMGLGYAIGFEREMRGQSAGDRTFALVALGCGAFTAIAVDAFPATAEKLIAGIPAGIGFIGGGLLLRQADTHMVRGLTTAAAIWAAAAIGVIAGGGRLLLAGLTTVLVIVALELRELPGLRALDARRYAGTDRHHPRDDME